MIRYCNTSFFVVIFRNGKTENYVNILSIIDIVAVGILSLLSLLEYHHRYLRLDFGASSSNSSAAVSRRCRCFVVVISGVHSCGCGRLLLRLIVIGVLSLLSALASPQSKPTHTFDRKFQQVIGTNR